MIKLKHISFCLLLSEEDKELQRAYKAMDKGFDEILKKGYKQNAKTIKLTGLSSMTGSMQFVARVQSAATVAQAEFAAKHPEHAGLVLRVLIKGSKEKVDWNHKFYWLTITYISYKEYIG